MGKSLVEEARSLYRRGSPKEALELTERSLAADAAKLSPRERRELWVLKSHSLNALGRWEQALAALEFARAAGDLDGEAEARLTMHKGYLMGSLAHYAECWSLLHRAEKAAQDLGLALLRAEVLWRRGMICVFAGEYSSAEKYLTSALEMACGESDRQLQGLATAGLGKSLMYQREYVKAIACFEGALAIFEELGAAFYTATVRGELGTCYLHLGETQKALELLEGSAATFLANGSMSSYQVSLADIGSVYLRRGEYLAAISYYQRALELARQLGDELSISKWLRNLCQAYSLLGNAALAHGFESEAELVNSRLAEERKRAARVAASLG